MKQLSWFGALALSTALMMTSACSSIDEIKSTKTYRPKETREGAVNLAAQATGLESKVVGHTTLLGFKIGRITVTGDTPSNMMKSVQRALHAAGYSTQGGASFSAVDAPYLKMHVESLRFGNFFFSSWGTVIVHLRLETRDGDVLWHKRIRSSVNAINNYERTSRVTMNRLVKDMTQTFVGEEFYQATQRIQRHNTFLKEGAATTIEAE